jgi:hypothetical protein
MGPLPSMTEICPAEAQANRSGWLTQARRMILRVFGIVAWATAVPGAAGHLGPADAWLYVLLPRSSTVEVAAPAPPVRLGPELALELHQAPDLRAVGADVGLDPSGQLADGGQIDAK